MKIKGDAIILTGGKFDSKSAKTAHGLLRGSNRFNIKAIIDPKHKNNYVHIDKNGKISLSVKKSQIQIFENLESFLKSKIIVKYLIIGVASAGGILPVEMRNDVKFALKNNLSIINGLHSLLSHDNE